MLLHPRPLTLQESVNTAVRLVLPHLRDGLLRRMSGSAGAGDGAPRPRTLSPSFENRQASGGFLAPPFGPATTLPVLILPTCDHDWQTLGFEQPAHLLTYNPGRREVARLRCRRCGVEKTADGGD